MSAGSAQACKIALGIEVELTKTAKDFLVEKGFDAKFGARPLRRAIQKYIEDPMAEAILGRDLGDGDTIYISHDEEAKPGELSFKTTKPKKAKAGKTKQDESKASDGPAESSQGEDSDEKSPTQTTEEGAKD
jgi:ATP-dependent Clp protease ATP-binding subunit ClpC